MKNKPINPILISSQFDNNSMNYDHTTGLSFREYAAVCLLQGLLANPQTAGSVGHFAEQAVKYADALIEELEETHEDNLDTAPTSDRET